MTLRSRTQVRGLGLSLALVLGACTAGGADDPARAGNTADVDTSDPDASAPDAEPSRTVLEIADVLEPPNFFPHVSHGGKDPVLHAVLMPLLTYDHEDELYSDLLEAWEVSSDGRTVTLVLRPGIEWSDGTPVSSADVVMTLTQALDPTISGIAGDLGGVAGLSAFLEGEADSISGLSAPDDLTVVVEFEELNPEWLNVLAREGCCPRPVLPAHVLGEVPHADLEEHEYFQSLPVTNGPYKFVEWERGQHVELERSDSWSLGEAGFERAFMKVVAPEVRGAQLETREVQFVWEVDPADADRLGSLDNIEILSRDGTTPQGIGFNFSEPLDPRVRQAMAYAINREETCESVLMGYCTVPVTNLPPAPEWAIPNSGLTEYVYDVERARELLDEAGWEPSTELTFLSWAPAGSVADRSIQIVQGNLSDVGINVTIERVDVPTFRERAETEPTSFDLFNGGGAGSAVRPDAAQIALGCDNHLPAGENFGYYCNEELDELWEIGRTEADRDLRAQLYQDAFRIINEDVPYIYLHTPNPISAYDSRLKGVNTAWLPAFWNIGEWHWED